jgi:hypothetical protein
MWGQPPPAVRASDQLAFSLLSGIPDPKLNHKYSEFELLRTNTFLYSEASGVPPRRTAETGCPHTGL